MTGQTVGAYRIQEKIGEGGMGAVYRGIDVMLERTVAVKVLRPELAQQPRVLDRFRSEAMTLARLNHPNIATLYSFLQAEDQYFMILEYVPGRTFEELLRQGPLGWGEALPLFCQALDGIAHAHAQGIVHRDIKPANVMLTDAGVVKVMDFGIARLLGTARMTRTGHLIGTIEYMSPEQVRGRETDERSDIYALGVLLYEMLTGEVPFTAASDFELMQAHVSQAPRPLRALAPAVPTDVERAVLRALAKKPGARFPDVQAFSTALRQAMQAGEAADLQKDGKGLERLWRFFAPAPASPAAAPRATRHAEDAFAAEDASAIKGTRLAEGRETRVAPETGSGAPPAHRSWRAVLRPRPLGAYIAVGAPVLASALALFLWASYGSDGAREQPAGAAPGVADSAATPSPLGGSGPFAHVLPQDQPLVREQPSLLSPQEFERLTTPPGQPAALPEPEPPPASREKQAPAARSTPPPSSEEPEAAPLADVRILVRPFGDIFVDDRRKAKGTNQLHREALAPGTYLVRAVHPTFGTWEKRITVTAGATHEVLFNFNAEYEVTVTSQPPNAEIFLDGRPTGRYTPSVLKVRPGQHQISVTKRGYTSTEGTRHLVVERPMRDPVHFTLRGNQN